MQRLETVGRSGREDYFFDSRTAAIAYRATRRSGGMGYAGMCAGRDAVKNIRPEPSDEEAMSIVDRAATYAAAHHPKWFWER